MPPIRIIFYRESSSVPVKNWLDNIRKTNRPLYVKCMARIRRLAHLGYELKRPDADYLGDGIYELRIRWGHVNYRILYFFFGTTVAVLGHVLIKEDEVPKAAINKAIFRMQIFREDPAGHSFEGDSDHEIE